MWIMWAHSTKSVKTKVVFRTRPTSKQVWDWAHSVFKNPIDFDVVEAR